MTKISAGALLTGLMLLVTTAWGSEIWEPPVSSAAVAPERTRIVKQGMEHIRLDDGSMYSISSMLRYRTVTNAATGLRDAATSGADRQEFHDYDVDGDGIATNDIVDAHPFSMTVPLSPDGPFYDTTVGSQRIFGGTVIYTANCTANPSGYSEDGMNDYEEGPYYQPRRNWTLFNEIYSVYKPFRMYSVWLWKKEDFLNGGADYPVSFDTNSSLNHLVMRYYMGIEGFRWVVRNNNQFYISEDVYKYADDVPGATGGKVHTIRPLNAKWAEYNPSGYRMEFNTNTAVYATRSFTNVTAVGHYMFKDSLISGYIGYKWYTFDAFATVNRPKRPGERIAMAEISGSGGVQNFYLSTCEVPYTLWRKVYRLANNSTFCSSPRGVVNFDNDGDQGSQDYPGTNGVVYLSHGPNEPVTDVTLYDVLAWCNALSVQETREPVYYTDATFTNIFSEVRYSPFWRSAPTNRPVIYVKWNADGFRLPAPKEWERAQDAGAQQYTATYGWIAANATGTTHAAGGLATNALGLYDMAGNVWELVWPFGNAFDPQSSPAQMALGGDLHYPNNPTNYSASAYGDEPFDGNYNIGFRLVRREAGLGAPDTSTNISSSIPKWMIAANDRNAPVPSRQLTAPLTNWIPQIDVPGTNFAAGITEVTFAQWQPVYDWAKANGYVFDYDAAMGSVDYWGWNGAGAWTPGSHGPNEPATGMSRYDAVIWLNALSELEGRTPVYYTDNIFSSVIKTSFVYRPLLTTMGEGLTLSLVSDANARFWSSNAILNTATGYRLPVTIEFYYTAHCGGSAKYPWGTDIKLTTNYAWMIDNSGLRTHPVAQLQPNTWGFYDMLGNVSEMSESSDNELGQFLTRLRLGLGFFDLSDGYPQTKPRGTLSGRGYPDVGLRVLRQKP